MRAWCFVLVLGSAAWADFGDGVSDDRLRLPAGPGSLEGIGENVSIDVNMGVMAHQVPFDLPAGFPGATPSLGLSYSSSGHSTEVGIGWALAVPTVERMTSRGLPVYDESDNFAADGGDQLVKVQSGLYRARYENGFVRWLWHSPGAEGYWEAQYPDGRRGFFGADHGGTLVATARVAGIGGTFRYALVEMIDQFGHIARYDYAQETPGGWSLLSGIGWVSIAGGATRYSVALGYETRNDVVSDATPGVELRLDQRLTSVDVFYNGAGGQERVRGWRLGYSPDAWLSQLVKVQRFGMNDPGNAKPFPIVHTFAYTQAIGATTGMHLDTFAEKLTGAVISGGKATLIDLNGDALPDVVDSSTNGPHRIWLAQLDSSGARHFIGPTDSKLGTRANCPLDDPTVVPLDVNGDGFTDLICAKSNVVLLNDGSGDWGSSIPIGSGLPDLTSQSANIRFFDYDGDHKIDLLYTPDANTTSVFRNSGTNGSFTSALSDSLGVSFASATAQMSDMNGDGMLDVVLVEPGQIRYRLNLGHGKWAATWTTVLFAGMFDATDQPLVMIEDLNGDSLSDVIVVKGTSVKFALNRNGQSFDAVQTVTSANGAGLPERLTTTTVVAADMNGNGSQDIVWIDGTSGQVTYLEMFAVRPNLITHIENNIGHVIDVSYDSTVMQMTRAREAGNPWKYKVPFAMTVVTQEDEWDRLTNQHDVTGYDYRDGFYDGVERQYRGHALVNTTLEGDMSQEDGKVTSEFDVGATDPYLHGLLLKETTYSGTRLLSEDTHEYSKCPVELEVQNPTLAFPIVHMCQVKSRTAHWEGTMTPVTTEIDTAFDGFGNVTKSSNLGVVEGCAMSCTRPGDVFGEACGMDCSGDEEYEETQYVPRDKTNGAWIINAPYRTISYGAPGGETTETLTYYDGNPFVGLSGELTQGLVTHTTVRADAMTVIDTSRAAFNSDGQVTDTLDALGAPGDMSGHRRSYRYDADGLRIVAVDLQLDGYQLERRTRWDERLNKVVYATDWMRIQGTNATAENASEFDYDDFGRQIAVHRPDAATGLPAADPTEWFTFDLKSPASRIAAYTTMNGESYRCVDGKGRTYQTRTRVGAGQYLVTGFTVYNKRSDVVQSFQPYSSASADCEPAPPSGVKFTSFRYDAAHRLIQTALPDDGIYGSPSTLRTDYLPLEIDEFDANDTDAMSPFANTPTLRKMNGLGRLTAIGRTLQANMPPSMLTVTWDDHGRMSGYVDARGNRKTQTYDLAGRLLSVSDPNSGTMTFTYDAAGNVTSRTDARGAVARMAYDGANRLVQRWDDADHDGTLVASHYDADSGCAQCSNAAGRMASLVYPAGKDSVGYDVRGRTIYSARTLENFTFETGYAYDDRDRLVSTTYPDGRMLPRSYDDAGRLVGIDGVISAVQYDQRGQPTGTSYANNTQETRGYDDLMRLVEQTVNGPQGPLQSLNLTRDRAGNLTAVTDPDKRLSAVFSYDAWYRTTGIDLGDEQLSYAFDELDNITSATSSNDKSPAHMGDYQYDSLRPNAVVKAGKLTMSYDAAGNLTQRGGVKLTWDALGRLSEAQLADGKSRYSFGGGADRVIAEEPHGVTHYVSPDFEVQDGLGVIYPRSGNTRVARLVSESLAAKLYPDAVADGKITAGDAFVAGAGAPQDRMLLSGARRLLYEELSQATYFGHDQVGSSTVETDDQGNVTGQRSFFAFGSERASSGDADRYGFTAQESDETGMLHFTYRQLDPLTGRWGSPDPAFGVAAPAAITRLGESTTAYAYVGNNPANFRDLHGLVGELATINRAKKYLTWKKDKAKSGATDAQVERATDVHNKLQAKQWSYASNMSAAVAFLGGVGYSHANNLTGAGLLSMAGFLFSIVNAHMALYEGHSSAVIALREADADEGYQQHLAAEEAAAAAQPGRRALTGNASAYVRALSREPDIERPAAPASSSSSSSSPSSASHPKDDIKRPENDEDWL